MGISETSEGHLRNRVAVVRLREAVYPKDPPYDPHSLYPEYPFGKCISQNENLVYDGVRELLRSLGFDSSHYGQPNWNPLGVIISPGMTVVIKPNFVLSRHSKGKDLFSIITHPSVLRAVADYCWVALSGSGRLIFADAPQYDCDFHELLLATGLGEVVDFYSTFPGPSVELYDLRRYWSRWKHFPSLLETLPGDKEGSVVVKLGKSSALYGKAGERKRYGAVYHREETIAHHNGDTHDYELSATIMNADVVVSVPKLKVHKKVGVTLNVKGLVGACTNKNYLVHYTLTPPSKGGDQYPDGVFTWREEKLIRLERWMYDHLLAPKKKPLEYLHRSIYWLHNRTTKKLGISVDPSKRLLDAGNWYGNDSAWRMAMDLLRAFYYSDKSGQLHTSLQRKMFSIIDGVVGGENNGPLAPDPKPSGVILGGENFVAVDVVATRLMGFSPTALRLYKEVLNDKILSSGIRDIANDIEVVSPEKNWLNCLADAQGVYLDFLPHPGWVGHVRDAS